VGASLPGMEWLPTSIYAGEALLAYVISRDGLTEDLRAIRRCDRSVERHELNKQRCCELK
jgi:hypothetical protein